MSSVSIELPESVSLRLNEIAERTGQSRTDFLLDAITEHVTEMEELVLAEERLAAHRAGLTSSYSLDEVEQRLGLVD